MTIEGIKNAVNTVTAGASTNVTKQQSVTETKEVSDRTISRRQMQEIHQLQERITHRLRTTEHRRKAGSRSTR